MEGITFDTGPFLALQHRHSRIANVYAAATKYRARMTVPAAVVAEGWRERSAFCARLLASMDVEPLDEELAKTAGEALAAIRGATVVGAIVMASAARRGDVVYTSDFDDLEKLRRHFPTVRVLRA